MTTAPTKKELINKMIERVMHPFVRVLLRYGVTLHELTDATKKIFFEEGVRLLEDQETKVTHSQLSVLTGLHRKDITTFMAPGQTAPQQVSHKVYSSGAAVVAEWTTNPRYLDASHHPMPLPYTAQGDALSFKLLVEGVSKDIRPKAHLAELLRLGIAKLTHDDKIELEHDAFVPSTDLTEKLSMFSRTIGDHMSAATANVTTEPAPYFDRMAFHGNLSEDDVVALRKIVDDDGMALIKKIYRQAETRSTQTVSGQPAKKRLSFGIYFFHESDRDSDHA